MSKEKQLPAERLRLEPLSRQDAKEAWPRLVRIIQAGAKVATSSDFAYVAWFIEATLSVDSIKSLDDLLIIPINSKIMLQEIDIEGRRRISQHNYLNKVDTEPKVQGNNVEIHGENFVVLISNQLINVRRLDKNKIIHKTDSLRPRWAEELRSAKQMKVRLEPDLIEKIEERAASEGLNRTQWIARTLWRALEP